MNIADFNRRLENLLRLGTISELDHAARKIRVKSGELITDWLPWPAEVGRNFVRWRPLRVGTQVILASVSGEPEQAQVIGMLYSESIASPSTDENIDLIQFDDGSYIKHNSGDNSTQLHSIGELTISCDAAVTVTTPEPVTVNGKQIDITANQALNLNGTDITLTGKVAIKGPVTQTGGDMTSDGISAQKHKHGGVDTGPGFTKEPQ